MRRSKLETHIDILEALARQGPLKLTLITYEVDVSYSLLKQYLNFLIKQDLVEDPTLRKKKHGAEAVYAITERGRIVVRHFKKLNAAVKQDLAQLPRQVLDYAFEVLIDRATILTKVCKQDDDF